MILINKIAKGGINIKKLSLTILSIVFTTFFIVSCASNNEPVKGVESSVSEIGNIENVKVTANQADIRSGCNSTSPVLQSTDKDSTLNVVNKVEDWYAVKLEDNSIGFVPENQCTPTVVDNEQNTPNTQTPNTAAQPNTDTPQDTSSPQNTPNTTNTGKTNKANDNNKGSLTQSESEMLNLVNQARAADNLPALAADTELANVARIKSQDMIDNNYFSHNSPTYGSPFDMLKNFGVKYIKAGENIAGNRGVKEAHEALMNSPGHRKNIMSPDYTHIGIGIKEGGQYGNMFTQLFISK